MTSTKYNKKDIDDPLDILRVTNYKQEMKKDLCRRATQQLNGKRMEEDRNGEMREDCFTHDVADLL